MMSLHVPAEKGKDPWHWDVDDVVQYLCNGLEDDEEVEPILRHNQITGYLLLVALTRETLKSDLGIQSLNVRFQIWGLIENARAKSAQFQTKKAEGAFEKLNDWHEPPPPVQLRVSSNSQSQTKAAPTSKQSNEPFQTHTQDILKRTMSGKIDAKMNGSGLEEVVDGQGQKRRRLALVQRKGAYLGDNALTVDTLFYGATALEEEVDQGVVGREIEEEEAGEYEWDGENSQGAFTNFQHLFTARPGESVYVNKIVKAFLHHNNPQEPVYYKCDGRYARVLRPVPSQKRRAKLAQSSITVIPYAPNGQVAYRASLQNWNPAPEHNTEKHHNELAIQQGRDDLADASGLSEDSKYLLNKYLNAEDDELLPVYGDSGSENAYDTDTLREIEEDKIPGPSHTSSLPVEKIREILAESETSIKETWGKKKLPGLQAQAWPLWSKARASGNLTGSVKNIEIEVNRLSSRLEKLKQNICEQTWTRTSDVTLQCQSTYLTVFDLATANWKLELLQKVEPPPKPIQSTIPTTKRQPKARPAGLADDEEELTDSEGSYEFIVDDTGDIQIPAPNQIDADQSSISSFLPHRPKEDMPSTQGGQSIKRPKFEKPREIPSHWDDKDPNFITISSGDDKINYLGMNLRQLQKEPVEIISKEGDARDKLAWVIARQADSFSNMVDLLNRKDEALIEFVYGAYESLLKKKYDYIKGLSRHRQELQPVFTLATWHIVWSKNTLWGERTHQGLEGIPENLINEMVEKGAPKVAEFRKFVNFSQERLNMLDLDQRKRQSRKVSSVRKAFGGFKSLAVEEEQRERARERQLEAEERREKLQAELGSAGDLDFAANAIVNLNKTEFSADIKINPHIASRMKRHQLEGVQFLWTEVVTAGSAQGCLLAQPMGMGKTMQIIAFLLTLAEAACHPDPLIHKQIPDRLRARHTVVLAPPSLVQNWRDEFSKWLPSGSENTIGVIHKVTSTIAQANRITTVRDWDSVGGVLLTSSYYFRAAILAACGDGTGNPGLKAAGEIIRLRSNIVVVDEAQELKNKASKLSVALRQVNTQSRIAMTGSPLANNLLEYYNLIDFVAPGYLGELGAFKDRYITPITQGQYVDAPRWKQRRALQMQKVLTRDIAPKVHRADIADLHKHLQGKTEFVIRVMLTDLQDRCYRLYVESVRAQESVDETIPQTRVWAFMLILKLLANHPQVFHDRLLSGQRPPEVEHTDIEGETSYETANTQYDIIDRQSEQLASSPSTLLDEAMVRQQLQLLKQPSSLSSLALSNKMLVLFKILHYSKAANDRILVFSHSLLTLNFVEEQIRNLGWNFIRIDGKGKADLRQDQTRQFNRGHFDVGLVSTRAGGVGLNLFGASRVVIMDDWFNPILEQQAIGRAYRIGQEKHVYVYRLVAAGTFEEALQNQALLKTGLANRIVDQKDTIRVAKGTFQTWFRYPQPEAFEDLSCVDHRDSRVLEKILGDEDVPKCFQSIKLGESFLVEENEELTVEEQEQAAAMIREEHLRRSEPAEFKRLQAHQQLSLIAMSRANLTGSMAQASSVPQRAETMPNVVFSGATTPGSVQEAMVGTSRTTTDSTFYQIPNLPKTLIKPLVPVEEEASQVRDSGTSHVHSVAHTDASGGLPPAQNTGPIESLTSNLSGQHEEHPVVSKSASSGHLSIGANPALEEGGNETIAHAEEPTIGANTRPTQDAEQRWAPAAENATTASVSVASKALLSEPEYSPPPVKESQEIVPEEATARSKSGEVPVPPNRSAKQTIEISTDDASSEGTVTPPRSPSYEPVAQVKTDNQTRAEPSNLVPKRRLKIPKPVKPRPVGFHGVDAAAQAIRPPSDSEKAVGRSGQVDGGGGIPPNTQQRHRGVAPALRDSLDHTDRSSARTALALYFTDLLPPLRPNASRKDRSKRELDVRTESLSMERSIYERARDYGEYQRLLETEKKAWDPASIIESSGADPSRSPASKRNAGAEGTRPWDKIRLPSSQQSISRKIFTSPKAVMQNKRPHPSPSSRIEGPPPKIPRIDISPDDRMTRRKNLKEAMIASYQQMHQQGLLHGQTTPAMVWVNARAKQLERSAYREARDPEHYTSLVELPPERMLLQMLEGYKRPHASVEGQDAADWGHEERSRSEKIRPQDPERAEAGL